MIVRIFIVDDEAPARRELRYLLEQIMGVEVVGEAANSTAALKGIRETKPHLLFLDIQMPGMNGLELAQFLCELPEKPLLVFATACDEHAFQAFEADAIDYLCKPFTQKRVAKTIEKTIRFLTPALADTRRDARVHGDLSCRIPLFQGESIIPMSPERILFARCEEGDVLVHTCDGRYHSRWTLNELQQKLAPCGFIRPHRSFLVNINHVREVAPWFNGSYKLFMDDREHTEIPVSRYNAKELKAYFDL